MRSKCRSLLVSLSLLSALSAFEIGAAPRFSFLQMAQVQAKGGEGGATEGVGESQDSSAGASAAKCAPGQGAAVTRGRRSSGGYSHEGGLRRMALDLSMLNLTDEQKSKIKAIRGRNAARAKELGQSLATKGRELRGLIFSESATNDQITAKRDEIRPLKDEVENLRLNDLLAIRAVFTPEQRKKWAEAELKPPERKTHSGGGQADSEADQADKSASTGSTTAVKVK